MADLDAVFKAYDIRGLSPGQLEVDDCRRIGAAFARFAAERDGATRILIARDMRPTGVELSAAFAEGVLDQGLDVVDLGMGSTDMAYFAAGHLDAPAAMFTASHNPAAYNGIKVCLRQAKPVGQDTGLDEVKAMATAGLEPVAAGAGAGVGAPTGRRGTRTETNLLDVFVQHVHSFVDTSTLKPLKLVADTANGMGGMVVPAVFGDLPFDVEVMYGELDGSFPNHPADPINPANQVDLKARVLEVGADVGLAFDGDADRVFLVDEKGVGLSGSTTTAIVAAGVLAKEPGATILYNCICSKAVPEVVRERGGTPIRTRVGHSFIKAVMAETGAAFGGEHSAHYYFRQNFRADSGAIAALLVLEQLSVSGQALSELRKPFERYAASGEINFEVSDPLAVIEAIAAHPSHAAAEQDRLDGLTVDHGAWWFNLRASNTEPLLRLNLEAPTPADVDAHVADLTALITGASRADGASASEPGGDGRGAQPHRNKES